MQNILKCVLFGFLIVLVAADLDWSNDKFPERWNKYSREKIDQMLSRRFNGNVAKNVLFFLGDGMGISTVTAGRIRKGQVKNNNGEEEVTNMEKLDNLALSKTYNIDAQTPDSAGTATAYLSGVKTRIGAIGVDGRAVDCPTSLNSQLESILQWAYYAGKSVGIVTTTRVTHATPAGTYAHVYNREMEAYDGISFRDEHKAQGCKDIAAQLIEDTSYVNLVFGGGRRKFMRKTDKDVFTGKPGDRIDGRNLIDEWIEKMKSKNLRHKYLWNITDFKSLKPNQYDHILGLLNWDHMDYEGDRIKKDPLQEPSINEMTEKAIEILRQNPNGYFLLVEGGKIDHAHHNSNAKRALDDYVAFDNAIGKAMSMVSMDETLVVVTADHSHVFTIGGYANRGNPLFGVVVSKEQGLTSLNTTFTALLYGNGPGFNLTDIRRNNLTNAKTEDINYIQESAIPLGSETHGGEDVAIFASGPMSYLFDGTVEQSYIAHVMAYSACIGPYNATKDKYCLSNRGVLVDRDGPSTPPTTTKHSNSAFSIERISTSNFFLLCFLLSLVQIILN